MSILVSSPSQPLISRAETDDLQKLFLDCYKEACGQSETYLNLSHRTTSQHQPMFSDFYQDTIAMFQKEITRLKRRRRFFLACLPIVILAWYLLSSLALKPVAYPILLLILDMLLMLFCTACIFTPTKAIRKYKKYFGQLDKMLSKDYIFQPALCIQDAVLYAKREQASLRSLLLTPQIQEHLRIFGGVSFTRKDLDNNP